MPSSESGPDDTVLSETQGSQGDSVRISPDVISIITGIAAQEVEGITGLSGGIVDGIAQKFGRKDYGKGIKVRLEGEIVTLDLNVVVEYGVRIMDTAKKLKQKVRATVEEITGLPVAAINVHVIGINLPKDKPENIPSEEDNGDA